MSSRNPRVSNASAQHLRMELDVVAQVETRVQLQRWWSLRFEHPVMEKRFQIYYEESSIVSSKWACSVTLGSAAALQAALFYDVFVLKSLERTPWVFVDIAVAGNALLLFLWCIFLWTTRRRKQLGAYFQIMIFTLGLSMLMLILVLGLPLAAYETKAAASREDVKILAALDEVRKAHDVTRTMFFLLILLGAIATTWFAQFLTYCALATCTLLALGGWIIGCSDYLQRQWHLVVLFTCSLFLLGRVMYCAERNLRNKFLRARRLMLENMKLSRQNSVMHQQLSCHVNAVGIGNGRHSASRTVSPNAGSRVLPQQQRPKIRLKNGKVKKSEPPAIGESWMENVLRSLVQLRQRLEDDEQTTGELDFVLRTLTSEHDLFLDTWSRQRRVPKSESTGEKAGTGWLSLLEEKRNRRRKTEGKQQQIPSTVAFLAKPLRRTSSGTRTTVLTLLENFLPAFGNIKSSEQKYWSPVELLALSVTSQELDLFAFAHSCTVPLTTLLLTTLESHNVFVTLPLRIESVADFAQEIETRYQPKNPYHNALHAASVVWDVNFFLRILEAPSLTPVQIFSALIAAAVHDVNHPGVNNAFLVATTAPLAIKYSDDSVLERMHLAEAFQTCTRDGCDIFEAFPPDLRRQSRLQIISMVLATDLSGHLTHVNRLKSKLYAVHPTPESNDPSSAPGLLLPDDLVLQTLIMMADIGHAMKSFPLHLAWSELVAEEFYRQGDTERQFGLVISPLCDHDTGVERFEKNQIGFLEFVVLPLYNAARDVLPLAGFDDVIKNVRQNAVIWEKRAQAKNDMIPDSPAGTLLAIPSAETGRGSESDTEILVDVGNDSKTEQVNGTWGATDSEL